MYSAVQTRFHGFSGGVYGDFGSLWYRPDQSPGPQQRAAEVPGHNTYDVIKSLFLQHLDHGYSGGAARSPVVGEGVAPSRMI